MKRVVVGGVLVSSYLVIAAVVGGYLVYRGLVHLETYPLWADFLFVLAGATVAFNVYAFFKELPSEVREYRRYKNERRRTRD